VVFVILMRKRRARGPFGKHLLVLVGLCSSAGVLAAAPALNGDKAKAILAELEPKVEAEPVLKTPIAAAKDALARASEARAPKSGEASAERATELDAIGLEWAELGRDLSRATAAEREALQAERELTEIETQLVRARALLEETWARRGRAETALKKLGAQNSSEAKPKADAATNAAKAAPVDAAKPAGVAPKKPAAPEAPGGSK
jgi:colicin import membrane protein